MFVLALMAAGLLLNAKGQTVKGANDGDSVVLQNIKRAGKDSTKPAPLPDRDFKTNAQIEPAAANSFALIAGNWHDGLLYKLELIPGIGVRRSLYFNRDVGFVNDIQAIGDKRRRIVTTGFGGKIGIVAQQKSGGAVDYNESRVRSGAQDSEALLVVADNKFVIGSSWQRDASALNVTEDNQLALADEEEGIRSVGSGVVSFAKTDEFLFAADRNQDTVWRMARLGKMYSGLNKINFLTGIKGLNALATDEKGNLFVARNFANFGDEDHGIYSSLGELSVYNPTNANPISTVYFEGMAAYSSSSKIAIYGDLIFVIAKRQQDQAILVFRYNSGLLSPLGEYYADSDIDFGGLAVIPSKL